MFKFITSRPLWVNILAIIVLIFLVVVLFFSILGALTKHNEFENVPAVVGMRLDEATNVLEAKGFEVEVQDSVYVDTARGLAVMRQSPDADAIVKANRTIYLTVNRAVAPLTTVPNMVGFSFRSAEMMLHTLGLKLGDTSYRPDIAKNSVLEQIYQGKPIAANTRIPMGSSIDFVLGSGVGNEQMNIPDLTGMTLSEARSYLSSLNINVGAIIPSSLAGNQNAYVYKTNPPQYSEPVPGQKVLNKIRPGQLLDIYLTTSPPVQDPNAAQ